MIEITSPQRFKELMQELKNDFGDDPEIFHSRADALMCLMLEELGYADGIAIFDKQERWYA